MGEIIADPGRGTLTGNRGCIHNAAGQITRRWTTRAWIACRLQWKGVRRQIMTPGRWTELFFLDEATALSAGHRPCAYCRRADYRRWQAGWAAAGLGETRAPAMDAVLHAARLAPRERRALPGNLPDGAMVVADGPALKWGASLWPWTAGGYGPAMALPDAALRVLTPAPVVAVIAAGYAVEPLPVVAAGGSN